MPKLAPTALILGCVALLAFAFVLPSNTNQPAATAYAQSTPSVSFTQEEVQAKEGSTIYLKVRLNAPVTKTTKVTIKLTPDAGTTSRDIPGLTGTKTVTFYKNGTQTKTVAIRTSRTAAEGDKSLTASITKVGNTTVQGDTARVLVKDQKSGTPLANNQNTTNTAPADCKPYEGVIPGETRKLNVVQKPITTYKPSGSMSAEGLRDLALMQGDIGFAMGIGPMGAYGWDRTRIPSGTVFSYKFKTTEYNYPPFYTLRSYSNPQTLGGVMGISISECPGDFTSPKVLDQKFGIDVENKFGDGKGRSCISYGSPVGVGTEFGVGAGGCRLETNKTYYINITAGFATDLDRGNFPYPYMSTYGHDGSLGATETVVDLQMIPQGHEEADRQVWGSGVPNVLWTTEIIKNRSAFYSEMQRIRGLEAEAAQRRIEACRAAIAAGRPCSSTR